MIMNRYRIFAVLFLVVLVGSVRAEDAKEVVVASAKELKGIRQNDHLEEGRCQDGVGEALCSYPV